MRRTLIGFFLVICLGQAQDPAAPAKEGVLDKLSFSTSFGYSAISSMFLQGFGGLKKSPDWMTGTGPTWKVDYRLFRRFGVFAKYESTNLTGTGPWELSSSSGIEQAAGVTGQALGTVKDTSYSIAAGGSFLVWQSKRSRIFLEGDVARVQRTTTFSGDFHGNDGQDDFVVPGVTDYEHVTEWRPEVLVTYWHALFGPFGVGFSSGLSAHGPIYQVTGTAEGGALRPLARPILHLFGR